MKKVILLAALTLIAMTGCKKDESVSQFSLNSSSIDFNAGQVKTLGYTANKMSNFGFSEVPKGWTVTHGDGKYYITAPASNAAESESSGTIKLTALSSNNTTYTRSVTVAVKTYTDITDRVANCIMISQPSKRFRFDIGSALSSAVSATRVWSTSKTAVVNVTLEEDGGKKYIYFATASGTTLEEANAVVAALDKNGSAVWSWHLWVTAYQPSGAVMDRNLGAIDGSLGSKLEDNSLAESFGLLYQWGRKDPFVGPIEWDSTTPAILYRNAGSSMTHAFVKSDSGKGTTAYAVANPNTFVAGAENSGYDWLYTKGGTERWNPTTKTKDDPCPREWRVASPLTWAGFEAGSFEPARGWRMGDTFYPAAGRRNWSPSLASSTRNYTNVVNPDGDTKGSPEGYYWSADYTKALSFTIKDGVKIGAQNLASGFSVRCVANKG